jgi:hypothetical protein
MSGVVVRPEGHAENCEACETKETRYTVTLSASIWLSGAPTCHTKQIILENVISWLESVYEGGDPDAVIDTVTAEEVTYDAALAAAIQKKQGREVSE